MNKLYFFNDVAQGREAGNSAIRQFEDDRNLLSISFIRELIQNAIDAWNKNSGKPVKLVFKLIDVDTKHQTTLKNLFSQIMPLIKMGVGNSSLKLTYPEKNLYKKNSAIYYVRNPKNLEKCLQTVEKSNNFNFHKFIYTKKETKNVFRTSKIQKNDDARTTISSM